MNEAIPLEGGRTTAGVVRIGDTVRRPTNPNSAFVHELLEHLEHAGFDAAPRFLGLDEEGREILSFHGGQVPPELQPDHDDDVLRAAAVLIRRYHDAVAGSPLAGDAEVVCHNDLSPAIQRETAGRRMAGEDGEGAIRWWPGQADGLEQSRAEYEEALG